MDDNNFTIFRCQGQNVRQKLLLGCYGVRFAFKFIETGWITSTTGGIIQSNFSKAYTGVFSVAAFRVLQSETGYFLQDEDEFQRLNVFCSHYQSASLHLSSDPEIHNWLYQVQIHTDGCSLQFPNYESLNGVTVLAINLSGSENLQIWQALSLGNRVRKIRQI